ncbi:uncharacterized protein TNCV_4943001 [Trichonephila clavipes]|nr:uncharacterized protein TNCV_4943001 [Trichonephila clavipes]
MHLVRPFHSGTCSIKPFLKHPCCSQMRRLFQGIFNTHNSHSWAAAPTCNTYSGAQDRFLVKWADIGDHLIGPYILPGHLTGPRYLIFLEQVLPKLLDRAHVTAATRTSMWFQQDGHFVFLFGITWIVCGERWIGRGRALISPIARPFLSEGQMKSLVYETPVNSAKELVQCKPGKYETKCYRMFDAP